MFRTYVPLLFSIVFFFVCLYINSLVQVWTDRNAPYWIPALPDIGHRLLPYWTYFSINNYYLLLASVSVFLRYVFQRDVRVIVFRRWLFVQALMFLMRSISIYVTSLSVPLPGCNTTAVGTPPVEAFYIMFLIHSTCGDVLFSGHTVTLTLCALAWTTYSKGEEHYPIRWLWCRLRRRGSMSAARSHWFYPKLDSAGDPVSFYLTSLCVWLFTIVGYLFIISTRFHYTVDVFLGFLLSLLTWKCYHYYIKNLAERRNIIITRFFLWFEGYGQPSVNASISLVTGPSRKRDETIEQSDEVIHPGDASFV